MKCIHYLFTLAVYYTRSFLLTPAMKTFTTVTARLEMDRKGKAWTKTLHTGVCVYVCMCVSECVMCAVYYVYVYPNTNNNPLAHIHTLSLIRTHSCSSSHPFAHPHPPTHTLSLSHTQNTHTLTFWYAQSPMNAYISIIPINPTTQQPPLMER
jgi:hypothetical protein